LAREEIGAVSIVGTQSLGLHLVVDYHTGLVELSRAVTGHSYLVAVLGQVESLAVGDSIEGSYSLGLVDFEEHLQEVPACSVVAVCYSCFAAASLDLRNLVYW
jgi:hypothetical protein